MGEGVSPEPGTESWGWAERNLGWGKSGRGCGKQLGWPRSQWGDGARLVSSLMSRGRAGEGGGGRQASPSSPPAPLAGWSAARERQAEPPEQPGLVGRGPRAAPARAMPAGPGTGAGWPPDLVRGELTKLSASACDLETKTRSCSNDQMLRVPWSVVSLMTKGCITTGNKSVAYLVDLSRAPEGGGNSEPCPLGSPRG